MISQMVRGVWFYGLSGSGKTYASQILSGFINNSFLIDGDDVRQLISTDLGYAKEDRLIQIHRLFGIGALALKNNRFPILSSVTMNQDILSKCVSIGIEAIRIEREFSQLQKVRSFYHGEKNVVGKDISLATLNTRRLTNDGLGKLKFELEQYAASLPT